MAVYVTGDTHSDIDIRKLNTREFPEQSKLTKNDYVIIAGDFGLVWRNSKDEMYWRKWYDDKNFTTLVVDGNHENFDLLEQFPVEEFKGGKVRRISDSILQLMRGEVYDIEGKKWFVMGGAYSYDKAYRKEGISWWKQEMPSEEEKNNAIRNLMRLGWEVDYVVTHTGPYEVAMEAMNWDIDDSSDLNLEYFFSMIADKLRFNKWYLGHWHIDKNITRKGKKYRVLYNEIEKVI